MRQWRVERHLDLLLRGKSSRSEKTVSCPFQEMVRPFDSGVKEGDVRLLQMNCSSQFGRLLYVAVLYKRENGTAVVAPFSRYGFPATKDEWLTGFSATPLLVLQLWNALPVPLSVLKESWRVERFTKHQLATAQDLYGHALRGSWPEVERRNDIGLAILDPDDERLAYQEEELTSLAPLRDMLYKFIDEAESLQHSKLRLLKEKRIVAKSYADLSPLRDMLYEFVDESESLRHSKLRLQKERRIDEAVSLQHSRLSLQNEWRIVSKSYADHPMPMAASSNDNILIPVSIIPRKKSKASIPRALGRFEDIGDELDIEVDLDAPLGQYAGARAALYVACNKTRQCYPGVVNKDGSAIHFNLASRKDRVAIRKAKLLGVLIFPK